jgi:TolB-like protein
MMEQGRRQETRRWARTLALAVFLLGNSGCGGTTTEVVTIPTIEQYRIMRVAVLPFTIAPPTPGQGRGYAAPAPLPAAAEKLTDLFYLKLNAREGIGVIPLSYVHEAMGSVPDTSRASLQALGEKLDVGAVLMGTVEVYKERRGSALGLERPQDAAEVGFTVRLVSAKDGATLWSGDYYEQQRPAIEDLSGFLERGARYLTVEELANSAVDHVLRRFPLGQPFQQTQGVAAGTP